MNSGKQRYAKGLSGKHRSFHRDVVDSYSSLSLTKTFIDDVIKVTRLILITVDYGDFAAQRVRNFFQKTKVVIQSLLIFKGHVVTVTVGNLFNKIAPTFDTNACAVIQIYRAR